MELPRHKGLLATSLAPSFECFERKDFGGSSCYPLLISQASTPSPKSRDKGARVAFPSRLLSFHSVYFVIFVIRDIPFNCNPFNRIPSFILRTMIILINVDGKRVFLINFDKISATKSYRVPIIFDFGY